MLLIACRYGMDYKLTGEHMPGKFGEWRFDKRSYHDKAPPRNLSAPPPNMKNDLVQTLWCSMSLQLQTCVLCILHSVACTWAPAGGSAALVHAQMRPHCLTQMPVASYQQHLAPMQMELHSGNSCSSPACCGAIHAVKL